MAPSPPFRRRISNNQQLGDDSTDRPRRRPRSFLLSRSTSDYPQNNQQYYHTFPNSSTSQLPDSSPPIYEDDPNELKLPPARFKIFPREEEGHEQLPGYTCSLKAESVFQMKTELLTPFDRCEDRLWSRVFVKLEGTMLKIHRLRTPGIFSKNPQNCEGNADMPAGARAGSLLRSYTLQHAEVGVAADYRKITQVPFAGLLRLVRLGDIADARTFKRDYVIRVRAESEQFLLSCETVDTFLHWLESLGAAIDLAPPLDERCLPRYQTIPRRRRRRPRDIFNEQERIIREQYPNLVVESSESSENNSRTTTGRTTTGARPRPYRSITAPIPTSSSNIIYESVPSPTRTRPSLTIRRNSTSADSISSDIDLTELREPSSPITLSSASTSSSAGPPPALSSSASTNSAASSTSASSVLDHEDERVLKWRPNHISDPEAELRRRRRCQRVLNADEPRLADTLIKDGKRWNIDYEKLKLVEYQGELPPYDGKASELANIWRRRGLPQQGF